MNNQTLLISRNKTVINLFWLGIIIQLFLILPSSSESKATLLVLFCLGVILNLINTLLLIKRKWLHLIPYIVTSCIYIYMFALNDLRPDIINFTFIFIVPVAAALFQNYKIIGLATIISGIEVAYFFIRRPLDMFPDYVTDSNLIHYLAIILLIGIFSMISNHFAQTLIRTAENSQSKTENVLIKIKSTIDDLNDFNKDLHLNVQELSMDSESIEILARHTTESFQNEALALQEFHHFILQSKEKVLNQKNDFSLMQATFESFLDQLIAQSHEISLNSENNLHSIQTILRDLESKGDKTRNIVVGFENVKTQLENIHSQK